jgi:hypothetical protein
MPDTLHVTERRWVSALGSAKEGVLAHKRGDLRHRIA